MAISPAWRQELGDISILDDAGSLRMRSRDFFWFSPILKESLEDKRADIIVVPREKSEVMRVAAACARHRIPLTVRGGGTGNYGQAVPLAGGVVLDMTRLDQMIWQRPAAGRFGAGARMLDIDRALAPAGQELRFYPSTRAHATIGGFIAGGAAGAGSCTWGQIADPGAVLAVEVVTVENEPRVIELRGRDVLKVMHAYGVNGIITEVEVPLAPSHPWCERIATFPSLATAARFAHAFTECDGIAKKLVTVHDPQVVPYLRRLAPFSRPGQAMVIVMLSEPQAEALELLVDEHGGEITFRRPAEDARRIAFAESSGLQPLYEFTWNHTTLHAIRIDPSITYLQLRFPPGKNLELVDWVAERFHDEVLLHLEFQRRFGKVTCSSLPLVRFTTAQRLEAIMEELDETGVAVSNPHTFILDNAGWKRVDAPQAEFKRMADPYGLMNPGKLAQWQPQAAKAIA
ncbi:MAG TPA: FAD-binding oxidoreductase [Xanthobacteraceae bacterium]|jgi:FAD/FMN-containing dehydrogenase